MYNILQQAGDQESTSSATHVACGSAREHDDSTTPSGRSENNTDELGLYDVICGRHKAAFNNIGNRRFRISVSLALEQYKKGSREEKSLVIRRVADLVRSAGGRFLHIIGGAWVELNEKQAHDKVGHALRDMAMITTTKAKSSTRSAISSSRSAISSSRSAPSTPPAKWRQHVFLDTTTSIQTKRRKSDVGASRPEPWNAEYASAEPVADMKEGKRKKQPSNQSSTAHGGLLVATTAEDACMEPIPWSPLHPSEPIIDDDIAKWLTEESGFAFQRFEF